MPNNGVWTLNNWDNWTENIFSHVRFLSNQHLLGKRIYSILTMEWTKTSGGDCGQGLLFQTVVGDGGFEPLGGSSFRPLCDGGSAVVSRRLPLPAGPAAPQHSWPAAVRGAAAAGGRAAAPAQGRQQ